MQQPVEPTELRPRPSPAPNRETTITRLACLKAACELGASRRGMKSTDIIKVAERFEQWVGRSS